MLVIIQHKLDEVHNQKYPINIKVFAVLSFLVMVIFSFVVADENKTKEYKVEELEVVEHEMVNITLGQVGLLDDLEGLSVMV